jgi:RNA polymerase primary sigma factor
MVKYSSSRNATLTKQETNQLLDGKTLEGVGEVILANMGLIISMADRFIKMGNHVEYDDLIQTGICGMYKAISKYKSNKGCKFSSYAYNWIKAEMVRFMRDEGRQSHYALNEGITDNEAEQAPLSNYYSIDYYTCLNVLNKKEAYIIDQIYGHGAKLREVGEVLGVTREYVRQLRDKALKKITNRVIKKKIGVTKGVKDEDKI